MPGASARAAIAQAIPEQSDAVLELRDVAWAQPTVVSGTIRVDIALAMSDDDRVGFEIFSGTAEREIIHCQGHAALLPIGAPAHDSILRSYALMRVATRASR
ncbi:MAG: hypothetical protein HC936_18575 [Leptolyngbyaceae cyanobacterium SU_3_3]|nr:hypothetical protein [Leptolyngbyaceae cyanobacterium SU_3_3]